MCTEKCDLIRTVKLVDVGRCIGRTLCQSYNTEVISAQCYTTSIAGIIVATQILSFLFH